MKIKKLIEKYKERAKQGYEYTPIGELISDLQSTQKRRKKCLVKYTDEIKVLKKDNIEKQKIITKLRQITKNYLSFCYGY